MSKLYSFKAFRGGAQFSKFSPTMKFHQIYEDLQVSEVPNQIFNCINHGEEIISKSYRFRAFRGATFAKLSSTMRKELHEELHSFTPFRSTKL